MSLKAYDETYIQNIADAIRKRTGTEDTYTVAKMADAIAEGIPAGTDTLAALFNGTLEEWTPTKDDLVKGCVKYGLAFFSAPKIVKIPDDIDVKYPGESFFRENDGVVDIDFGGLIETGAYACSGCKSLKTASGFNIISISERAFNGCTDLTTVLMPSATLVEQNAFSGCSTLADVTGLAAIEDIGNDAFSSTGSLADISPLTHLHTIGSSAFMQSSTNQGLTAFENAPATQAGSSIGANAFQRNTKMTKLKIKFASVGGAAFAYCSGLTTCWISSECTTIDASSKYNLLFGYCSRLTAIYTDAAEKPAGWGTYFNYTQLGSTATVHYGVTEAEYDELVAAANNA